MKKIFLNIFAIIIMVAYCFIMTLGNVGKKSVNVAVVPGSYADTYADKNHLTEIELSDNMQPYFDKKIEFFDFNTSDNGIVIENYEGRSIRLVIPEKIGGASVRILGEGFISGLHSGTSLYLPDSIKEVEGTSRSDISLYLRKDSSLEKELNEKGWAVQYYNESDDIDFNSSDTEFDYNFKDDTIEIYAYHGNDDVLVIPSYINGYPVVTVSMALLGNHSVYVFPETVTLITDEATKLIYDTSFVIGIIFNVLAFVFFLISINIILSRFEKTEEFLLRGPQVLFSVSYLILQTAFTILTSFSIVQMSTYAILCVDVLLLVFCIFFLILANKGRSYALKAEQNIQTKTEWMRHFSQKCMNLGDGVTNPVVKKQVARLVEDIRYSDKTSNDLLTDIESELEAETTLLRSIIETGNDQDILDKCKKVHQLLDERNRLCKSTK